MAQRSIPTSAPAANPGRKLPLNQKGPIPNISQTQSPVLMRSNDSTNSNEKMPGSSTKTMLEKPNVSPKLYRHPLNKEKIDAMVKSAYKEESDSVKVSRFALLVMGRDLSSFIVVQVLHNVHEDTNTKLF